MHVTLFRMNLIAGGIFSNVITPVQNEMFLSEGANITLSCNYSSAYTLQWYSQYPGQTPQNLLVILFSSRKVSQRSEIVDQDPQFSGKRNDPSGSGDLICQSDRLCSVLLCSLPIMIGNTTTQYTNLDRSHIASLSRKYQTVAFETDNWICKP